MALKQLTCPDALLVPSSPVHGQQHIKRAVAGAYNLLMIGPIPPMQLHRFRYAQDFANILKLEGTDGLERRNELSCYRYIRPA
jgi:hypothetical protein